MLAAIAGGAAGVGTFMVTGAGLVATPSPGSVFAYAAVTPRGGWFGVFLGIAIAAGVSFAVASTLLGFGRLRSDQEVVEEMAVGADRDRASEAVVTGQREPSAPAVTRTATREA